MEADADKFCPLHGLCLAFTLLSSHFLMSDQYQFLGPLFDLHCTGTMGNIKVENAVITWNSNVVSGEKCSGRTCQSSV